MRLRLEGAHPAALLALWQADLSALHGGVSSWLPLSGVRARATPG